MALEQEHGEEIAKHGIPTVFTGMGKLNAYHNFTIATHPRALKYRPKLIINLGSCGGSRVGELLQCYQFGQWDFNPPLNYEKPYIDQDKRIEKIKLPFDKTTCLTGDSFCLNIPKDCIVDMEAYALALASQKLAPFLSIKYCSDAGDVENWKESLPIVRSKLGEALDIVLEKVLVH